MRLSTLQRKRPLERTGRSRVREVAEFGRRRRLNWTPSVGPRGVGFKV